MLNYVFLIPIDHRGIQGNCFEQYLKLQSWCDKNNSEMISFSSFKALAPLVTGLFVVEKLKDCTGLELEKSE